MKYRVLVMSVLIIGYGNTIFAGLFSQATKELQNRFMNPLIDIKNTADNTRKILRGTKDVQDKVRTAGAFIDDLANAMNKLIESLGYVNDTFVTSFLSKNSHNKIQELVSYAQSFMPIAHEVSQVLKKYERPLKYDKELNEILGSID